MKLIDDPTPGIFDVMNRSINGSAVKGILGFFLGFIFMLFLTPASPAQSKAPKFVLQPQL